MKRSWLLMGVLICLVAGVAWSSRGFWRDSLASSLKPTMPAATTYFPEKIKATSTLPDIGHACTSTSCQAPVKDIENTDLPKEVNLNVPFLSQAPKQNWDMPYQEACEEASMLMVNAYFDGKTKAFTPNEGDKAILDIVAFEEAHAIPIDITIAQVGQVTKEYFDQREARVLTRPTKLEVKTLLARGFPVIIPADGKALKNPNFNNGGPPYHMLVIKGYLADGRWITNDPGTRKGADYVYDEDILWNAIHDWNGGNVPQGTPAVFVMEPTK